MGTMIVKVYAVSWEHDESICYILQHMHPFINLSRMSIKPISVLAATMSNVHIISCSFMTFIFRYLSESS